MTRNVYVPRDRYLCGQMAVHIATRITAHGVSRWADTMELATDARRTLDNPGLRTVGDAVELPPDPPSRHRAIEAIFDLMAAPPQVASVRITLRARGDPLMVPDGAHFLLRLESTQFGELQQYWRRFGLPLDLCTERGVDDPLPWPGTESERTRQRLEFVLASGSFLAAVSRRQLELQDPGSAFDEAESEELVALDAALGKAMLRATQGAAPW